MKAHSLPHRLISGIARTAVVVALVLSSPSVRADFFQWTGASGVDDDFDTAGNWNPSSVPSLGDLAVASGSALPTISITTNATVDSLRLSDGGSALVSTGFLNIFSGVGPDNGLWVGEFGSATSTLTQTGGSIIVDDTVDSFDIGRNGGATGIFNMSGGTLTNNGTSDAFFVGRFGNSNGSVNLSGGTLNGPASADTHIGLDGTATWTQSGGTFNAGGVHVGRFQSPTATVALSGTAVWNTALTLLSDGSAALMEAVRSDLTLEGGNISFNSTGLVIRQKGNLTFDGQGGGLSTIHLNTGELLLDGASLFLDNLPEPLFLGMEIVLIDGIGTYSNEAVFANAADGALFGDYVLNYRATDIVLTAVPEPQVVALIVIGLAVAGFARRKFA